MTADHPWEIDMHKATYSHDQFNLYRLRLSLGKALWPSQAGGQWSADDCLLIAAAAIGRFSALKRAGHASSSTEHAEFQETQAIEDCYAALHAIAALSSQAQYDQDFHDEVEILIEPDSGLPAVDSLRGPFPSCYGRQFTFVEGVKIQPPEDRRS